MRVLINTQKWYVAVAVRDTAMCSIAYRGFTLHVGCDPQIAFWGYHEQWWDGPIPTIGFGPFAQASAMYGLKSAWCEWPEYTT